MKDDLKKALMVGLAFAVAALILLGFSGCGAAKPERHSCVWYDYFDTECTLLSYNDMSEVDKAIEIVSEKLKLYDELCDIYDESLDYVNACELNKLAGQGPVQVSRELFDVLKFGKEMYMLTDGECNIAFGAVLSLWHDAREAANDVSVVLQNSASESDQKAENEDKGQAANQKGAVLPSDAALLEASMHCNIDDLILDEAALTVELADPEMSLDLGAVTKGYVTDVVVQALTDSGFTGYVINLGGNVKANGEKLEGEPWVTGIANPEGKGESAYVERVKLTTESLVTSGSYQRYFELDGKRYHHIISPETLYPKDDFLSVTILAESSAMADALSTAVFNMAFDEGLEFIESLEGVEAAWIFPDMSMEYSSGFRNNAIDIER